MLQTTAHEISFVNSEPMGENIRPRLIEWEFAMGESEHDYGQEHRKDGPAKI